MASQLKNVEKVLDELPPDTLHAAMARAFAEIEAATKDSTNPHFRSKYADLSSVIAAIKPALVDNGLFFTQHPHPAEGGVCVETFVYHRGGEALSLGTIYVPANKQDAQGYGSAITYARRYALQTGFGVPTEDDDGNRATESVRPTTGEAPPAKRVPLDGPYTCKTQLQTAAKQFVRTLESMGDLGEFLAWQETKDFKEFCTQLERDMRDWWSGGPSVPPEFVPLEIRIDQKKRDLEQLDGLKVKETA